MLTAKVSNKPCQDQVEISIEHFGIDLVHQQINLVQATPDSDYIRLECLLGAHDNVAYPSFHDLGNVSGQTNNSVLTVWCKII